MELSIELGQLRDDVTRLHTQLLHQDQNNGKYRTFIHSFIHSLIHPLTHSLTHPPTHPPIHPSIHPSIHPFIHSFIHLFTYSLRIRMMPLINRLTGTLKPQSNVPLYSNTVIGTLAVDG